MTDDRGHRQEDRIVAESALLRPRGAAGMPDGLTQMVAEHEALRRALNELAHRPGSAWDKKLQLRRIRQRICEHDDAEASVLAPFVRHRLQAGHASWRSSKQLYRRLDSLLARMDRRSISSPDLPHLLAELNATLDQLIDYQETSTFPQLRATLTGEELVDLGEHLARAHRHADRRPHPLLGHSGLVSHLLGPEVAMVDNLRDRTPPRL